MSVKGLDEVSFKEKKVSHKMKGLCKGRFDDIRKTENEIKKQGLTIWVDQLIKHRNRINDDTLQLLLEPRRVWPR